MDYGLKLMTNVEKEKTRSSSLSCFKIIELKTDMA